MSSAADVDEVTNDPLSNEKNIKPSKAKKHTKNAKKTSSPNGKSKSSSKTKSPTTSSNTKSKSKPSTKSSAKKNPKSTTGAHVKDSKRSSKVSKKPATTTNTTNSKKNKGSGKKVRIAATKDNKGKSTKPKGSKGTKGPKGSKGSKNNKNKDKSNNNNDDVNKESETDEETNTPIKTIKFEEDVKMEEDETDEKEITVHKRNKTDYGYTGDADIGLDVGADTAGASTDYAAGDSDAPPAESIAVIIPSGDENEAPINENKENNDNDNDNGDKPKRKGVGFAADVIDNEDKGILESEIIEDSGYESEIDHETEKRKKILRYRRHQSRYKLAKISELDDLDAIKANNEALGNDNENKDDNNNENGDNGDGANKADNATGDDSEVKEDDTQERRGSVVENDDDDEDYSDEDGSVRLQKIELSQEQEAVLDSLELAFLDFDSDFYGFVPLYKFYDILKRNELEITDEEMKEKFEKTLMLIDDGVDYYGFLRHMREYGTEPECEGKTLIEIMEYMAEMHDWEERRSHVDFTRMRTRSLANWKEEQLREIVLDESDPLTPLKRLMEDMALDDDEIDFASLKTALQSIECNPKDSDLEFLIDYLDTTGTGMIDFQYFFKFLHDAAINKRLWKNLTKLIESVAGQLRRAERAEKRRKTQNAKLKSRLEQRKRARAKNTDDDDAEAKKIAEEKKKRALELRQKAKQYKA